MGRRGSKTAFEKGEGPPVIAFFDFPDVFEDFYPHYGLDQQTFATQWSETGSHAFLSLLQKEVGDVIWYEFSLKPEFAEARHEVVGCRVRILSSSWLHRRLWHLFYMPRFAWRWRRAYPLYALLASYVALFSGSLLRALRSDRPDFFFVQDYATGRFDSLLLLAKMLGIPLVAYHAGSRPEEYLGRLAKRWTIRRADRVIASSQDELEMLAGRPYRVPLERLCVILTPIDTHVYRPLDRSDASRGAGLEPDKRYLLFMGRLDDKVKRVSALIRIFGRLAPRYSQVELLLAGDGPDMDQLQRLAEERAPGRVRFLGWVSGAEKKVQLYNLAECLVLQSEREGFPTVVGEAMCCGTPVVATRVGGVAELVTDGETGWLCPPGDDAELEARLAFVLSHREIIDSMRPKVRAVAESRLSPETVGAALRSCFGASRSRGETANV